MSLHPLIPLRATAEDRFALDADWSLCVGRGGKGFLFGGVGLAAAVLAMETTSRRPALWASCQFTKFARPGAALTVACTMASTGKSISQARALISDSEGETLSASAALGAKDGGPDGQWAAPPDVPPPEDCPEKQHWSDDGTLSRRFRFRPARGHFGTEAPPGGSPTDGRLAFWIRSREDFAIDRIVLAVIADFFSPAIRNATGRAVGGNSLDNSIRYGALVGTGWALCEVQVEMAARGFVHGSTRIFAECGTLLASASQTMIMRERINSGQSPIN